MTDPIILHTYRDARTLACPLCEYTIDVPPVPVSAQLGEAFGMSGDTLARVHGEQVGKRLSLDMRAHLRHHDVVDWLARLTGTVAAMCDQCGRARMPGEPGYDPMAMALVMGRPPGWYSADDGEMCGQCMTGIYTTANGATNG